MIFQLKLEIDIEFLFQVDAPCRRKKLLFNAEVWMGRRKAKYEPGQVFDHGGQGGCGMLGWIYLVVLNNDGIFRGNDFKIFDMIMFMLNDFHGMKPNLRLDHF